MRTAIWQSMLDADMNARYWRGLVARYSKKDKTLKIFLALMASGTVAGWGLWITLPWLWKTLSSLSAIVAIAMPILNYQKHIEQMSYLAGKWGELRIEYEDLWLQVKNNSGEKNLENAYKKFRKIESGLQEREIKLPEDKVLLIKCFNEVKTVRGLT
jgi:hypothetical protein